MNCLMEKLILMSQLQGDQTLKFAEKPADASAPGANQGVVYCKDSGGGKTQLVVRFPTGAVQTLATEP